MAALGRYRHAGVVSGGDQSKLKPSREVLFDAERVEGGVQTLGSGLRGEDHTK